MLETCCFFIVEEGEPFQKGENIPLLAKYYTLGRSSKHYQPDIVFGGLYVSRRHAALSFQDSKFFLTDLDSTHGTRLNGQDLTAYMPYELKDNDRVELARGLVSLIFKSCPDLEKTISLPALQADINDPLFVDTDKKQIWLRGNLLNISGKARDLLLLLYENKNKAVSYEEIKRRLWSERPTVENNIPDVSQDEITSLIYRLRNHLGHELGPCVVTVPRFGLVLNLDKD